MPKKKQRIMLHMHQLRDFIDDRYSFYNNYFEGKTPAHYQYRGVQKAFLMGSAIDFGIKQFYANVNRIKDGYNLNKRKEEKIYPGDNILNCKEFKALPSKIDQTIAMALLNGYISRYYSDKDTQEYFHNFHVKYFKIPFIWGKKRKLKQDYVILCSPDLLAETFYQNELVLIEIKTSGDPEKDYTAETLDFQTMCYVWASYRWNFKVPKCVIKRTLMKPRIKQKKDETTSEFQKRIVYYVSEKEDKIFKSSYRPVDKNMILDFEKYLTEILYELDNSLYELNTKKNIYKFYKKSKDYWGT